jgi:hypothetical protein
LLFLFFLGLIISDCCFSLMSFILDLKYAEAAIPVAATAPAILPIFVALATRFADSANFL